MKHINGGALGTLALALLLLLTGCGGADPAPAPGPESSLGAAESTAEEPAAPEPAPPSTAQNCPSGLVEAMQVGPDSIDMEGEMREISAAEFEPAVLAGLFDGACIVGFEGMGSWVIMPDGTSGDIQRIGEILGGVGFQELAQPGATLWGGAPAFEDMVVMAAFLGDVTEGGQTGTEFMEFFDETALIVIAMDDFSL